MDEIKILSTLYQIYLEQENLKVQMKIERRKIND